MNINDLEKFRDLLMQCYKHQDSLEEILSTHKNLPFSAQRKARDLYQRNEELITQIHNILRGKDVTPIEPTPQHSAEIIPLFK